MKRGDKMSNDENTAAHRLMESFTRLKRIKWHPIPIEGLTHAELMVLFCIKKKVKPEESGLKVSELSNFLNVAPPTITQSINSLDKNGFVLRKMDAKDRRAVQISLTVKGENAIKEAERNFLISFNKLSDFLGEEDSNKLADLLSKVYTYFNDKPL